MLSTLEGKLLMLCQGQDCRSGDPVISPDRIKKFPSVSRGCDYSPRAVAEFYQMLFLRWHLGRCDRRMDDRSAGALRACAHLWIKPAHGSQPSAVAGFPVPCSSGALEPAVLVTWDAPFLAVVLVGLWHPRVASVKKRGHRGKSRRRGPHRVTALPVGRPTWAASGSCCSPLDTAGAERRARSRGWGWHSLSPHCCDAARNPELCHVPGTWWGEALT